MLTIVALAVTGCMRAHTDVVVHDDSSATVAIELYPDVDSLERVGGARGLDRMISSIDGAASGARSGDGGALRAEAVDDGRGPGVRVTWEVDDVEELTRPVPLSRSGDTGLRNVVLFRRFDVDEGEDGWQLDGEVVPIPEVVAAVLGSGGQDVAGAEATLSVTLPGRIRYTNADGRDGETSTWEIDANSPSARPLVVQTDTGWYVNPVVVAVAVALVAIVAGAFMVLASGQARVRTRLRRGSDAARGQTWAGARPTPSAAPDPVRRTSAPEPSTAGLYSDVTGDDSVALPVGGASWGPAPSPSAVGASAGTTGGTDARPTADGSTPPPPPQMPPGWYPDPEAPDGVRFWDGERWTGHRG